MGRTTKKSAAFTLIDGISPLAFARTGGNPRKPADTPLGQVSRPMTITSLLGFDRAPAVIPFANKTRLPLSTYTTTTCNHHSSFVFSAIPPASQKTVLLPRPTQGDRFDRRHSSCSPPSSPVGGIRRSPDNAVTPSRSQVWLGNKRTAAVFGCRFSPKTNGMGSWPSACAQGRVQCVEQNIHPVYDADNLLSRRVQVAEKPVDLL